MRARIFGALLIALVTLAALPAALRVQQAPGPEAATAAPTATRCARPNASMA